MRFGRALTLLLFVSIVAGCASPPPRHQQDLCSVFDQHPDWYDYARESQKTWGTPIQILMSEWGTGHNNGKKKKTRCSVRSVKF